MGGYITKRPKSEVSMPVPSAQQRPILSPTSIQTTCLLSTQKKDESHPAKKGSEKFAYIPDQYSTLDQVTQALRDSGLESSNLIVAIDFTKSNEWTGKNTFNGLSLHSISSTQKNPYEQAMSIIGETLSHFDEDNLIPCYGFGDVTTHDRSVFNFYPDGRPCNGFLEALARYREIAPKIQLSGPTSFAPAINAAMGIVEQRGGEYHVLLIIADGQVLRTGFKCIPVMKELDMKQEIKKVTRSIDTTLEELSLQEKSTIEAIVQASQYPLSIVLVGVGDGPWDMMEQFDDRIPKRVFDNFQFVNFTRLISKNLESPQKEAAFALGALMEIPLQYQATVELKLLNRRVGRVPNCSILPPPTERYNRTASGYSHSITNLDTRQPVRNSGVEGVLPGGSEQPSSSSSDSQASCPICLTSAKNLAFGCGHQTCWDCGQNIRTCPLCRRPITSRLKLYT